MRISELARPNGMQCEFDEGWYHGQCRRMTPTGPFCAEHAAERCKGCGEQATYSCGHAESFACGQPRCDTCDCPGCGLAGAPGSHGWKWGKREQNAMTAAEEKATRWKPTPATT